MIEIYGGVEEEQKLREREPEKYTQSAPPEDTPLGSMESHFHTPVSGKFRLSFFYSTSPFFAGEKLGRMAYCLRLWEACHRVVPNCSDFGISNCCCVCIAKWDYPQLSLHPGPNPRSPPSSRKFKEERCSLELALELGFFLLIT